jgi:hypothetical protein
MYLSPLSQVQQILSVLSETTLNNPTLIKFQDYHTCAGGISLSEYGYASDSDLDEEGEGEGGGGEIDEIVKDSGWFYLLWYRIAL